MTKKIIAVNLTSCVSDSKASLITQKDDFAELCSLSEDCDESFPNIATNQEMDSDDENTQDTMMISDNAENEREQIRAITRTERAN